MGSATGEHFVALNRPISTEYFRGGCTIDWARSGDLALHPWGCVLASAAVQQVDAGGHARRLVLAVLGDGGEHAQAHLGMRTDREDGVGRQRSGLTPDEATLGARGSVDPINPSAEHETLMTERAVHLPPRPEGNPRSLSAFAVAFALAISSFETMLKPVTLPPGRARLATKPV